MRDHGIFSYIIVSTFCLLNFSVYINWDWFLVWDRNSVSFIPTQSSSTVYVRTLLSPCETTTAFVTSVSLYTWICFWFLYFFCWSIHLFQCQYKTILLTTLYNNSLYLVRQVSSPCSSSSGMSWLFLNLFSSIYILESACQVPQKTCWDFYWNCIESIYQFEENWQLYNIEPSNSLILSLSLIKAFFFNVFKHFYNFLQIFYKYFIKFIPRYFIFWMLL